ncbi:hypothetical protein MA16_Dca007848 [Dendrobium catenatum]|uniref:Uncharacterized protein n=1 Tax=Dendrobium catenatum TaxID=906689 RepID=A0A2I0XJ10_9ASPA|nr:hypothetical protein MA16_Dca007848 [Dendrobium catenatum]
MKVENSMVKTRASRSDPIVMDNQFMEVCESYTQIAGAVSGNCEMEVYKETSDSGIRMDSAAGVDDNVLNGGVDQNPFRNTHGDCLNAAIGGNTSVFGEISVKEPIDLSSSNYIHFFLLLLPP